MLKGACTLVYQPHSHLSITCTSRTVTTIIQGLYHEGVYIYLAASHLKYLQHDRENKNKDT